MQPSQLLATGRASEIVDLGGGRVAGLALPDAVAYRIADPNVNEAERARARRMLG